MAMERRGIRQAQLAELASTLDAPLSQPAISALITRDSETSTFLFAMAKALRVNPEWLQTGKGESGLDSDAWIPAPDLSKEDKTFLELYRRAEPQWQLTLRLLALLGPRSQAEISGSVNVLLAEIFGREAASDERVEAAYGFPPGAGPRVHEPGSAYDSKPESGQKKR